MTIKFRVAEIMKEKGLNVTMLSKLASISYKTALDLQKGNSRRVDLDTLEKICAALDVTPSEIFELVPSPKKNKPK